MIQQINTLAQLLENQINQKLLLFVEDLDKFDRKETAELFLEHSRTLTMPEVHIVYSFPVAMHYTNEFPEIVKAFDAAYYLHNISLLHRDNSRDEKCHELARSIILKRVAEDLFQPGVLDETVNRSGGHVKTLIQLAQQAALNAIVDGDIAINSQHLDSATAKLRDDYITLLTKEQIELLKTIHTDQDKDLADMKEEKQKLLFNGSLLEYGNTRGPWGGVNPIVCKILDR